MQYSANLGITLDDFREITFFNNLTHAATELRMLAHSVSQG